MKIHILALSPKKLIVLCILLIFTYKVSCSVPVRPATKHYQHRTFEYIKKSCKTTLYPTLCYKYLAKHAVKIKKSPKILATTALFVTLNKTRSASTILKKLSKSRALRRREVASLLECVEVVGDSVYELNKSMNELNESRKGGPEFALRMNDVETWVSAALTDDDTCMDDFTSRGKIKVVVRRLVRRIARLTSISLAFINNYAGV